jgi:methionyl-tRNA formyltransferase
VCVLDKNEEWCKIYDAKILLEEHDLDTGSMICTKNENYSRKWFYSGF